jgi:chitosanase
MASVSSVLVASLALLSPTFAQSVDGSKYNNPTAGPPSSYFAAATSIPVAALKSAAAKASTAAKDATYPINNDGSAAKVTIHSDWSLACLLMLGNIGRSFCLGCRYGCGL